MNNNDSENNDSETNYGLVLSFSGLYPTMAEEHAFVHGVELGGLWARMTSGTEAEIEGTYHSANHAVIERACASQGWDAEIKAIDGFGDWITARLTKRRPAARNPHGLKVVRSQGEG